MMRRLALRKQIEPQSANRKNRLCVFVPLWFKPFPRIVSLVLALICVAASAHTLNSSAPPDSVSGSATASAAQFTSAASSPFQVSSSSSAVLETITLRGAGNEVLREYQIDNGDELNRWKWTKDYVYAGSKLLASESPGGIRHYHVDHLGTTRVITDAVGTSLSATPYEYFPFGDEATVEPPNDERFRFTGHERDINDPLKPDYMHARYYYRGGSAGKFLSVDPGRDWDAKQPQSWNLYAYVRNNPINLIDPDGRMVGAPVTFLKGLQTLEAVRSGAYERQVRKEMEDWLAHPQVQKAMKIAWQQSGAGVSNLEAGFTHMSYSYTDPDDGQEKDVTLVDRQFGNTTNKVKLEISPLTKAVWHTHPNRSGGEPSTPENNYSHDRNGGDTKISQDNRVPVIVMHRTGLRIYDPVLNKSLLIREGMSWLPK